MHNKISKNKVVTLIYALYENDVEGVLIEKTSKDHPFVFIYGIGQMIPGFEKHILDLSTGDSFKFTLAPGEAYGATNAKAIVEVPIANFKDESGRLDTEAIKVGKAIRMKNQHGQSFQGIVVESGLTEVKIDFNHPMAGRTLYFEGKILDVRDAREEELAKGIASDLG